MPKLDKQEPTTTPEPAAEPARPLSNAEIAFSRLRDKAMARFTAPDYTVTVDERKTIWVKRTDGARSIGFSLFLLRRFTSDEILDRAEARLTGRTKKF